MKNKIHNYIEKFELNDYINEKNIIFFALNSYEKDSFILMSGEKKNKIYLFVEGVVKVTRFSADGDEVLLELMKPFDIFGDIEYILGNENTHNVQVVEKCTCLELNIDYVIKNPILFRLIAKTLAGKLLRTSIRYSNSQLLNTNDFVLDFIKENEIYLTSPFKYSEMAKLVGLSERQLRRVLKHLVDEKLIKKLGKTIILL